MTAAIIGFAGAAIGALFALLGSAISDRRQARHESARWRRDQRSAAYDGAFRSLTKAASHRYKVPAGTNSGESALRDWFDDIVEAQYRIRALISHCYGVRGGACLPFAAEQLTSALAYLSANDMDASAAAIDRALELVAGCARKDMGSELQQRTSNAAAIATDGSRPGARKLIGRVGRR